MKKPERLTVCIKDVMRVCGISKSSAWRQLKAIREFHNKKPKASVSLVEFCSYHGLETEDVINFLY